MKGWLPTALLVIGLASAMGGCRTATRSSTPGFTLEDEVPACCAVPPILRDAVSPGQDQRHLVPGAASEDPSEVVPSSPQPQPTSVKLKLPPSKGTLSKRWGVELLGVRLSAHGTLLDVRFRVLDPVAARPLLSRDNTAALVHRGSGAVLSIPRPPKIGPLRQTLGPGGLPAAGRVYFMLFGNPGRSLGAGDRVDLVIGPFRAENLTIE